MSSADPRETITFASARWSRSWLVRYGFAVAAVTLAAVLQSWLERLGVAHLPFLVFVPVVLLVPTVAGFWPGIVATLLATVGGCYFMLSSGTHGAEALVRPIGFLIVGVFLTALTSSRKGAVDALKESEAHLNRAQAVGHIGSWRVDIDKNTMSLSKETYRLLGLPAGGRVTPQGMLESVHPDDKDMVLSQWRAALGNGTYDTKHRVTVGGQTRWIHVQASLELDEDRRPVAAVGTIQDITERRQSEERLKEFEKVVESLDEMIVVLDRDYRYVLANHAFLKRRGLTREQVIGHHVKEVVDPGAYEAVKAKVDECFAGKIVEYELKYKYPQLGERDLQIAYFPIEGPAGVERLAAVFLDVTEKKRSEQALRLFRTLIDQSNDAVEVVDPETLRFLDINERACKDLGYSREELLKMTVFDIDPKVDESMRTRVMNKLQEAGSVVLQSVHRRKDRSEFPVEIGLRRVQLDRPYVVTISRDISDRKKAEDALRESEDRYRDLVEHSEDLVCTHDLAGRLVSANPAPARVLGYTVSELLQIPMRVLVAPEFREAFDGYLSRIKTNGADEGVLCVLTRSGERRIWEYKNTLRTEGVASPIVRGMAHDVTERVRSRALLKTQEAQFRTLVESSPAAMAISAGQEQKVEYYNPRFTELFGYTEKDAPDVAHWWPLAYPEEAYRREISERWNREVRQAIAKGGQTGPVEARVRCKDGTEKYVEFKLVCAGDKNLVFGTDLTARKQAEEALRSSEQQYRLLFEKSVAGVVMTGIDGIVIDCNEACARMFGFESAAECRGCQIADRYPDPSDRQNLLKELQKKGSFLNRELELLRKDGSRVRVLINSVLLANAGGQPSVQTTVFDITERKKAEEALRRREEDYRRFVAQSSEGIFRQDLDAPLSIDLPEDELVQHILHDSYMAECNDAIAKMYGFASGQEFIGKRLTEMLVADDPRNIELTREYIRSGFRVLERESHEVDIRGNPKVFRNSMIGIVENGRLLRTWGIQRDVTEQLKLEAIIRDSEERFRVALKGSPTAVFTQDRDLRFTWIYNFSHLSPEQVLGKTDEEIAGLNQAPRLKELKRQVLETGVGVREEVAIPFNGGIHAYDMTVEPVFDADGKVVGITGAAMDIARLRDLADSLQDAKEKLVLEKSYLESEIQTELGFEQIIGQSRPLREILKKARVVAATDSTVLLLGETGTGKELVARSIHALSSRHERNFIKLNCAAVPTGLLESELFGHEKGAFTGAVAQKVGRLELADKGTLFLDEVGELPLELQPKLLRVLQDREFERLGGVRTLRVDVRIVSATNRDLRKDVAEKRFREDLFYRLNVFPIELPALRDRRSDIPMLVHHFVSKHAARMGARIDVIPLETMAVLENWTWPGNIRELENMIERMVIMSKGHVLAPPPAELHVPTEVADNKLTEMEREHIIRILRETRGVLSGADGAASRLGIKRTTLQSMLKRFNIQAEDFRHGVRPTGSG